MFFLFGLDTVHLCHRITQVPEVKPRSMASLGHCLASWRSLSMHTLWRVTPSSSGVRLVPLSKSSLSATGNGSTRASTSLRSTPTSEQVQEPHWIFLSWKFQNLFSLAPRLGAYLIQNHSFFVIDNLRNMFCVIFLNQIQIRFVRSTTVLHVTEIWSVEKMPGICGCKHASENADSVFQRDSESEFRPDEFWHCHQVYAWAVSQEEIHWWKSCSFSILK